MRKASRARHHSPLQEAVEAHLLANGIICPPQSDGDCVYWQYQLAEPRMLGWICLHQNDCRGGISASIAFGLLRLALQEKTAKQLLDENSFLPDGLYYSSFQDLISIGFVNQPTIIPQSNIAEQLTTLSNYALASQRRFVRANHGIDPIPHEWLGRFSDIPNRKDGQSHKVTGRSE